MMSYPDQVIIKQVPSSPEKPRTRVRCDCVDELLGVANPECMECGGTGYIEYRFQNMPTKERLAEAKMCFENAFTIWNDEDDMEVPLTDIVCYLKPDENVKENDIITFKGKDYQVVEVKKVRSIENIIYLMCSLDRV